MAHNESTMQQQPVNIWTQMSYVPPRGPCSQKSSVLSTCACFRFMVHPLKAATSYDCDGCGHHASFHKMENTQDEEVVQKWRHQADKDAAALLDQARHQALQETPKRRKVVRNVGPGAVAVIDSDSNDSMMRMVRKRRIQN